MFWAHHWTIYSKGHFEPSHVKKKNSNTAESEAVFGYSLGTWSVLVIQWQNRIHKLFVHRPSVWNPQISTSPLLISTLPDRVIKCLSFSFFYRITNCPKCSSPMSWKIVFRDWKWNIKALLDVTKACGLSVAFSLHTIYIEIVTKVFLFVFIHEGWSTPSLTLDSGCF